MPEAASSHNGKADVPRRVALRFIILLGVVSLFADATYEGARSITGPYLAVLGAGAAAVGIVSGLGEFLGYALRLVSGYVSDRTGRYWAITIAGYAVNLFAVPMLALAERWEVAALLIVIERAGRAIRTPARDAMLSHAASRTGLGWGFGLHEALDQVGAVLGPLLVGLVIALDAGYDAAFAALALPALIAMAVLVAAALLYPRPRELEVAPPALVAAGWSRPFWLYVAASALIAAGFADFPLIAFHFGTTATVAATWIPFLFALAMAGDAVAALVLGRLYDRIGLGAVLVATLLSMWAAPLAFLGGPAGAVAAMVLWGVGMGAQESVMRAAIASLAPAHRRATAFGLFNAFYGAAWFAGSALLGILYEYAVAATVAASVVLQGLALPILLVVLRAWRERPRNDVAG